MEREARVERDPKKTLDDLVKTLGESGNAHRSFLNVLVEDGMKESKSKPAPAKKVSNAAKWRSRCRRRREVLGDGPELEGQRVYLTKEIGPKPGC